MATANDGVRGELREDGGVLLVTLDRPKGNVLSMAMMTALGAVLEEHARAPKLKLVMLRGAGGNFSFGASVPEHAPEAAPKMLSTFHALVRRVAHFPVPIAALVEGKCLGGAFELVLAAHFVFATADAVFACPELKLGVIPPVLAVLGAHRLGAPLTERLLLTGAELPADEAAHRGFVELVPTYVDAGEHLFAFYKRTIAPLSAYSLREATFAVRSGSGMFDRLGAPLDAAEKRYLERLLPSHDGNEGIRAFLERRPPHWTDA